MLLRFFRSNCYWTHADRLIAEHGAFSGGRKQFEFFLCRRMQQQMEPVSRTIVAAAGAWHELMRSKPARAMPAEVGVVWHKVCLRCIGVCRGDDVCKAKIKVWTHGCRYCGEVDGSARDVIKSRLAKARPAYEFLVDVARRVKIENVYSDYVRSVARRELAYDWRLAGDLDPADLDAADLLRQCGNADWQGRLCSNALPIHDVCGGCQINLKHGPVPWCGHCAAPLEAALVERLEAELRTAGRFPRLRGDRRASWLCAACTSKDGVGLPAPRQQQPPPLSPEMRPLTLDDEQTYNEIDSLYERDLSPHENGPSDGTTRCADGTPRSVARQVREARSCAATFRSCYSEDQDVECMGSGDEAGV